MLLKKELNQDNKRNSSRKTAVESNKQKMQNSAGGHEKVARTTKL